jgi:hypothetical protein
LFGRQTDGLTGLGCIFLDFFGSLTSWDFILLSTRNVTAFLHIGQEAFVFVHRLMHAKQK